MDLAKLLNGPSSKGSMKRLSSSKPDVAKKPLCFQALHLQRFHHVVQDISLDLHNESCCLLFCLKQCLQVGWSAAFRTSKHGALCSERGAADALSWFECGGAEWFQARKWNTEQFISHSLRHSISSVAAFGFKNCASLPKRRHRCFGRPSCHCTGPFSSPIFGTGFHLCSNVCEGFHESISAFDGSRCPCRETSRIRGALVYKMLEKDHILVAPASFFDTGKWPCVASCMHVSHIAIYTYIDMLLFLFPSYRKKVCIRMAR